MQSQKESYVFHLSQSQYNEIQTSLQAPYSLVPITESKEENKQQFQRSHRDKKPLLSKYNQDFVYDKNSTSRSFNTNVNNNNSEILKSCQKILNLIKKHPYSKPFLQKVDAVALDIPDYYDIIKEPMDLSVVSQNLHKGYYKDQNEFQKDMNKIWKNSLQYNDEDSEIYQMTIEIQNYFEQIFNETMDVQNQLKKIITKNEPKRIIKNVLQPMTKQEKQKLSFDIRNLPHEYLIGVWKIVCEGYFKLNKGQQGQSSGTDFEFDLDTLPIKQCRDLEIYIKKSHQTIQQTNKQNLIPKQDEFSSPIIHDLDQFQINSNSKNNQNQSQKKNLQLEQNLNEFQNNSSFSSFISDSEDS